MVECDTIGYKFPRDSNIYNNDHRVSCESLRYNRNNKKRVNIIFLGNRHLFLVYLPKKDLYDESIRSNFSLDGSFKIVSRQLACNSKINLSWICLFFIVYTVLNKVVIITLIHYRGAALNVDSTFPPNNVESTL